MTLQSARRTEQSRYRWAAVTRSTSTGTKTKSYAGNGVYEALSLAIVADLATESVDGDADDIACRRIVEAPDMLRDGRCRHDGTAVAHEVLQQTEFCPREARRHTVEIERAFRGIETERADLQRGDRCLDAIAAGTASLRSNAREELAVPERLDDVVIRAHVQSADLVVLAAPGGQHDDREARATPAQIREQLEAVPGLQVEVDDGDERVFPFEKLDRTGRLGRNKRNQTGLLHDECKQVDELLFVVHQQDLGA